MKFWKKKNSSNSEHSTENREFVAEALEPRILYSGAPVAAEMPDATVEAPTDTDSDADFESTEDFGGDIPVSEDDATLNESVILTSVENLTDDEIDALAQVAIERWKDSDLSEEQLEALELIEFSMLDLDGAALGYAEGSQIYIDEDAAGEGWFVDATPFEDEEFYADEDGDLTAIAGSAASDRIDLLSVLQHEIGHVLGLEDIYASLGKTDVMYGFFEDGERRTILMDQAEGAEALSLEGTHYALAVSGTAGDVAVYTVGAGATIADAPNMATNAANAHAYDFDDTPEITPANDSYELNTTSDPSQIALSGGHHLVLYGTEWRAGFNARAGLETHLKVNGEQTNYGASAGYARTSTDNDIFTGGGAIIEVSQGDYLELESSRTDVYEADVVRDISLQSANIQLVKLDDTLDYLRLGVSSDTQVFAGNASDSGPAKVAFTAADEVDSGSFAHSTTANADQITLKNEGYYLVFANTGFDVQTPNQRQVFTQSLTLNNEAVSGSSSTVYLRNSDSTDASGGLIARGAASIGMIVEVTDANSILSVSVERDNDNSTESVNIDAANTGLTILKLPAYGSYITMEGAAQDVNDAGGDVLDFTVAPDVSNSSFEFDADTSSSQVKVKETGDYLFFNSFYADDVDTAGGDARTTVKQGFQVTPDGDSATALGYGIGGSYNRDDNAGADRSRDSGSWTGAVVNLEANDAIEATTEQVGGSAALTATGGVYLQGLSIASISSEPADPVISVNAPVNVLVGTTGTVIGSDVLLTLDSNSAATALTYTIDNVPTGGTFKRSGTTLGMGSTFTQDDVDNSRITFDAVVSEFLDGGFSFTVRDDGPNPASGSLVVNVGVAMAAADDSGTTDEDTVATVVSPGSTPSVLDNDIGTSLVVFSASTTSALGAIVSVNADGTFAYDPRTSASLQALDTTASTTDSFEYTVRDFQGTLDTRTVMFTVNGINDAPRVVNERVAVTDRDGISLNLLANERDVDLPSDTLIMASFDHHTVPGSGTVSFHTAEGATVTVAADGSFTYDVSTSASILALADGSSLSETLTYEVSDGDTNSTASITIISNGAAGASDDQVTVNADDTVTISVLSNDTVTSGIAGTATSGALIEFLASTASNTDTTWVNTGTVNSGTPSIGVANGTLLSGGSLSNAPVGVTAAYSLSGGTSASDDSGSEFLDIGDPTGWPGAGDNLDLSDATIELVFRPSDQTGEEVLFETGGTGAGSSIVLVENQIVATISSTTDYAMQAVAMLPEGAIANGEFVHLVVHFNLGSDDGIDIFVNNVNAGTANTQYNLRTADGTTTSATDWSGTDDASLGRDGNAIGGDVLLGNFGTIDVNNATDFTGEIATFRIYNSLLDVTERTANFESVFGVTTTSAAGSNSNVADIDGTTNPVGSPVSLSSGAQVTLKSDGTFTYDPYGAFDSVGIGETAMDSFTYSLDNDFNAKATVVVTINGTNLELEVTNTTQTQSYLLNSPGVALDDLVVSEAVQIPAGTLITAANPIYSTGVGETQSVVSGPVQENGLTFQMEFTPDASDLTGTVMLMEIGGTSNGTSLVLVDGVLTVMGKMGSSTTFAPGSPNDTDFESNGVILVQYAGGKVTADSLTRVTVIYDPIPDGTLKLAVNGEEEEFALQNVNSSKSWSGDNSVSVALSPGTGAGGMVTATGSSEYYDTSQLKSLAGPFTTASYYNDTSGYVLTDNDQVTATLTLADKTKGSLSDVSGNGESYDSETGIWTVTGDTDSVNAALAAVAFVPVPGNTTDTSVTVTITDEFASYITGNTESVTGTVTLNYVPVTITSAITAENGDLEFEVTLDEPASTGGVTVTFSTANGTAMAGTDYTAASGSSITIAEGETTGTISIATVNDTVAEVVENLTVTISGLAGFDGVASTGLSIQGTGVIVDNEVVYVDSEFSGTVGDAIIDADSGTTGNQAAIFGVNAFATIEEALGVVDPAGTIIVNDGTYTQDLVLTGTVTIEVTGSQSATISGKISGNGDLVKDGTGTLTLSGADSSATGNTTVNAGILAWGARDAFGSGTITVKDGGTVDMTFISGNTNSLGSANRRAYVIEGEGSAGQGALINSSGDFSGSIVAFDGLTLSGNAKINASARIDIGGVINLGEYTLTKTGLGRMDVWGGLNSPDGLIIVDAGSLYAEGDATVESVTVNSGAQFGAFAANMLVRTITADITLNDGAILFVETNTNGQGSAIFEGKIALNGATTITTNGFNTDSNVGNITVNSFVSGTGTLTLDGTAPANGLGFIRFNKANAFEGTVQMIDEGVLQLGNSLAFANATVDMLETSVGTLDFDALTEVTFGALTGANNILLENGSSAAVALSVGNNDSNTTYSGSLSGSGSLVKTGDGFLILAGDNNYTGTTTVSSGVLVLSHANALGAVGPTSGTTVNSGAQLRLTGGITFAAEQLTVSGIGVGNNANDRGALRNASGANTWTGAITLTDDSWVGSSSDRLTISGGITATDHTLRLDQGVITVTDTPILIGSNRLYINSNLSLQVAGNEFGDATIDWNGKLTTEVDNAVPSDISVTLGTTSTNASAGDATIDLKGHDMTVARLIDGSTSDNDEVITNSSVTAATFTVAGDDDSAMNGTFTGNLGLVKTGNGTLALSGSTSDYTGTTQVTKGVLLVNGDHSAANGAVSVASGAALGGIGTIGSAVTIDAGADLRPGNNNEEELTINGDINLNGELDFDISGTNTLDTHDEVDVSGVVTLNGTLNIIEAAGTDFTGLSQGDEIIIFDIDTGSVTGQFTDLPDGSALTIGGTVFEIDYTGGSDDNDVVLRVAGEVETSVTVAGTALVITDKDSGVTSDDNLKLTISATGYSISDTTNSKPISINIDGAERISAYEVFVPFSSLTGVDEINFDTLTGVDVVTIDFAGLDETSLQQKIIITGGDGDGDTLAFENVNFARVEHTMIDPNSGEISLDSDAAAEIEYSGLEPVLVNSGTVTDFVFNLPAGTADSATLSESGGMLTLDGATFESTKFAPPSGSITVNGQSGDSLTVSSALNLSTADANGTGLILNVEAIDLNGGSINTGGSDQVYNGSVTLGADTALDGANVSFFGTVDGANDGIESLTVNITEQLLFGGDVGAATALESLTTEGTGEVEFAQRSLAWEAEFFYTFDSVSGNVAEDLSENDRELTYAGDPLYDAGAIDGSVEQDGTDDYGVVTGYKGIGGTAARTMTAWIKVPTSGTNTDDGGILSWGEDASGQKWVWRLVGDNIRVEMANGGIQTTGVNVRDGEWHFVAAVFEGTTHQDVTFYVDGVAVAETTSSGTVNTDTGVNGSEVFVGTDRVTNSAASGARDFNGELDEVGVWSRALSAAEIAAMAMPSIEVNTTGNQTYSNEVTLAAEMTFESDGNITFEENVAQVVDGSATVGDVSFNAVNVVFDKLVNLGTDNQWTLDVTGSSSAANGVISGDGSMEKRGTGTLTLAEDNTFTGGFRLGQGSSSTGGFVVVEKDNAFGTGLLTSLGSRLLTGSSDVVIPNELHITNGGLRIGGANDIEFAGAVLANGSSRTISLHTTSGIDVSFSDAVSGFVMNTEVVLDPGSANNTITVFSVMSGASNLIKNGDGTVYLLGDNTYTGTTAINEATLLLNGVHDVTAGTAGDYTVASGAKLGGTGSTDAVVIVNAGGELLPGLDTGDVTDDFGAGTLTLADSSVFAVDLEGTNDGEYDQIDGASGGFITIDGTELDVSIPGTPGFGAGSVFKIIDSESTTVTKPFTIGGSPAPGGTVFEVTDEGGTGSNTYVFTILYNVNGDSVNPEGTTGNDVVLVTAGVAETEISLDGSDNLVITDINGGDSNDSLTITEDTTYYYITDPNLALTLTASGGRTALDPGEATQVDGNTIRVLKEAVNGLTVNTLGDTSDDEVTFASSLSFNGPVVVNSETINIGGDVTTTATGTQTYNGAVTLTSNAKLTGTEIVFESTVDGGFDLDVDASTLVRFKDAVGGVTRLTSLDTEDSASTEFGTGYVTATAGATLNYDAANDDGADNTWSNTGSQSGFDITSISGTYVTNPALTTSIPGISSTYDFDGSGSGGNLSSIGTLESTKSVSFEMWIRPGDLTGDEVLFETGGGNGIGIFLGGGTNGNFSGVTDSQITFSVTQNSLGTQTTFVSADLSGIGVDEFIQVVGVFDTDAGTGKGIASIYINGAFVASGTESTSEITSWGGGDAAGIGRLGGANMGGVAGGAQGFTNYDGEIALFRVYTDKVLTIDEIQENYQALTATVPTEIQVNTSGAQTFGDKVILGLSTTLDADTADVVFTGTVDDDGNTTTTSNLVVNTTGLTQFADAVGGTDLLQSVTTNAGGTVEVNGGGVTTSGDQSFGENLTTGGATTFMGSGLSFAGTADFTGDSGFNGSSATFGDATTVTGGTTSVDVSGDIVFQSTLELGGNGTFLGGNDVLFAGMLSGGSSDAVFVEANKLTRFNQVDVASLQVVGGTRTELAGDINLTGVENSIFFGKVRLNNALEITTSGGGDLRFYDTVDSEGAEENNLTVTLDSTGDVIFHNHIGQNGLGDGSTGLGDFSVGGSGSGEAVFGAYNAAINNLTPIVSFNAGIDPDTSDDLYPNLQGRSDFDLAFNGSQTFTANPTSSVGGISASYRGAATGGDFTPLPGNPTDQDGTLEFWIRPDSLVGGNQVIWESGGGTQGAALLLEGDVLRFIGQEGTNSDGSIAPAKKIDISTMLTAGEIGDFLLVTVVYDRETSGGDDAQNDTITLYVNGQSRVSGTNNVDDIVGTDRTGLGGAGNSIGSNPSPLVSGSYVNFNGEIASWAWFTTALDTPTVAASYDAAVAGELTVKTTGTQTFDVDVELKSHLELLSSGNAAISLNGQVDGARDLTITTSGATTIGGGVGIDTALSSLTTDVGGTVDLGGSVITTGDQTFNENAFLIADTSLTSTDTGNITFEAIVNDDGTSGTGSNLSVTTDGTITFNGEVGNSNSLSSLTTHSGASGTTELNASVTTVDDQVFEGSVNVDGEIDLTGANIYFQSYTEQPSGTVFPATVTIGAGESIDVIGNLLFGVSNQMLTDTRVTVTGGGALTVTGSEFQAGVASSSTIGADANNTTVDLSGLGSFVAVVTDFRVGFGQNNESSLLLSNTSNTITADRISVSDTDGGNQKSGELILGSGYNFLYTDHLQVGISKGSGTVTFESQLPESSGTLVLRAKNGTDPADVTLAEDTNASTSAHIRGTLDLRGHVVDVLAETMVIAHRTKPGTNNDTPNGHVTGALYFDTGTFTVDTVDMANRLDDNSARRFNSANANLDIAGGTFTVNESITLTTIGSTINPGPANGTLNLSGGTLDLTNGSILPGDGTPVFNFTGGTLKDVDTVATALSQAGGVFQIGADGEGDDTKVGGDFVASSGVIEVQLNGSSVGQYDRIIVDAGAGTDESVTLSGVTLDLTLNFAPSGPGTFVLVDNDGTSDVVTGAFANYPRVGATTFSDTFELSNGVDDYVFRINYAGGDGNDVVLESYGAAETRVEVIDGELIITDINSDSGDNLTISYDGDRNVYIITDPDLALTVGSGVTRVDGNTVEVAALAVTNGIRFETANGADTGVDKVIVAELPGVSGGLVVNAESIELAGDVSTTGNQSYNGAVVLTNNAALTGVDVVFASTVDGDFILDVAASGVATFVGDIGAVTPLASINTDGSTSTEFGVTPAAPSTPPPTLNYDANLTGNTNDAWNSTTSEQGQNWDLTAATGVALVDVSGTTSVTGITQAYRFTGDGDDAGPENQGLNDISGDPSNDSASWEFWIKPTDTGDADQLIFETGGSGDGMAIWYSKGTESDGTGTLNFTIDDGGVQQTVSAAISSADFSQVVAVYERDPAGDDRMQLYINGVSAGPVLTTDLDDWDGGDTAGLGSLGAGGLAQAVSNGQFTGDISIYRFYETALTDTDIDTTFDAVNGQAPIAPVSISTSGDQTFGDQVVVKNAVNFASSDGDVFFNGSLDEDGDDATASAVSIATGATGSIEFTGAVGATDAIQTLTTTGGGAVTINDTVETLNQQDYSGNVTIENSGAVVEARNGYIAIGGNFNGLENVTLNALGGNLTVTGTTDLDGATNTFTAASDIDFSGIVDAVGPTTISAGESAYFRGDVQLSDDLTVTAADTVDFEAALTGAPTSEVTVNADILSRFGGAVSTGSITTSLAGRTEIEAGITFTGTAASRFNDQVLITGADVTIKTESGSGDLTFHNTIDSETREANSLTLTLDGGDVFLNGDIGEDYLEALSNDGGLGNFVINGTSGKAWFGGRLNTAAGTTPVLNYIAGVHGNVDGTLNDLTGQAASNLNFSVGNNVTFDNDPDTGFAGITGAYTFHGGKATAATFQNAPTDPSNNDSAYEFWFKPDDFTDSAQLIWESGGQNAGSNMSLDGSVLTFTAKEAENLFGQVSFDLSLLPANEQTDFIQATLIYNINTDSGGLAENDRIDFYINGILRDSLTGLNLDDIAGTDGMGLGGPSGSASTSIGGTDTNGVDEAIGDTDTAPVAASDNFEGQIAVVRVYSELLNAGDVLNTFELMRQPLTVTTTGDQTYGVDVLTEGTRYSGANVTFNAALDSTEPENRSDVTVQLAAGGTATFAGTVGGSEALATLTTSGNGTVVLSGDSISVSDSAAFYDAVELGADIEITNTGDGNIHFGSTVDSVVGDTYNLTVNTNDPGTTIFSADVGVSNALGSVTTDEVGFGTGSFDGVSDAAVVFNTANDNDPADGWSQSGTSAYATVTLPGDVTVSTNASAYPGITDAFNFNGSVASTSALAVLGNAENESATWEIWFKPDDLTGNEVLFETGGTGNGTSFNITGNEFLFATQTGAGNHFELRGALPSDATSEFVQAVVTLDQSANELKLFINGVQAGATVDSTGLTNWDGGDNATFGGLGSAHGGGSGLSGFGSYHGDIAIFNFYQNQTLTPTEVARNFAAVAGSTEPIQIVTSSSQGESGDQSFGAATLGVDVTNTGVDVIYTDTLNLNDNDLSVDVSGEGSEAQGVISGDGSLTKEGAGTFTTTVANTYTGTTDVNTGSLIVNGTHIGGGDYTVAATAILGGNGSIDTTGTITGGIVAPGDQQVNPLNLEDDSGIGTLTVNDNITVGGMNVEIDGNTKADLLDVVGTVSLSGMLKIEEITAGAPTPGSVITLINNDDTDSVTGTFSGLEEGATVTDDDGNQYVISYAYDAGGDGNANDVVLFAGAPETSISLGVGGVLAITDSGTDPNTSLQITYNEDDHTYTITGTTESGDELVIGTEGFDSGEVSRPDAHTVVINVEMPDGAQIEGLHVNTAGQVTVSAPATHEIVLSDSLDITADNVVFTSGTEITGATTATVTASSDITFTNTQIGADGLITLNAGDNITLDADSSLSSSGGEIRINVDQGGAGVVDGGIVNLYGEVITDGLNNKITTITGGDKIDVFNIVPSENSEILVKGGDPTYPETAGDALNITNGINPVREVTGQGAGFYTFGGGQEKVVYENIERDNVPTLEIDIPISQRLQPTTLNGEFTDYGPDDTHTLTVVWKDGSVSTFEIPASGPGTPPPPPPISSSTDGAKLTVTSIDTTTGKVEFTVTHTYATDGLYDVEVTVVDSTASRAEAIQVAQVYFLAPSGGNPGYFSFASFPGQFTLSGYSGLFTDMSVERLFATDESGNDITSPGENQQASGFFTLDGEVRVVYLAGVEHGEEDLLSALTNSILNGTPLDLLGTELPIDEQEVLQLITNLIRIDVDGVAE